MPGVASNAAKQFVDADGERFGLDAPGAAQEPEGTDDSLGLGGFGSGPRIEGGEDAVAQGGEFIERFGGHDGGHGKEALADGVEVRDGFAGFGGRAAGPGAVGPISRGRVMPPGRRSKLQTRLKRNHPRRAIAAQSHSE